MLPADLTDPIYADAEKAREYLESIRWPDGPVCAHCGVVGEATLMQGKAHRAGLYQCNEKDCMKQFSVTVGTLYERSHIPLNKWLLATHLLCSSKKGISAHQLYRNLGFGSYRSAWFMAHRIREGMAPKKGPLAPLGGEGKTVEADETFIGGKEKNKHKSKRASTRLGGSWGKQTVLSLVERNGAVRSHHVASVTANSLRPLLKAHIHAKSQLYTDDAGQYRHMHRDFAHEFVNHGAEEYVRGNVHTNTVEGYFSVLKRGVYGTYHHVSEQHLHRYLAEFDFRYSNRAALKVSDAERTVKALKGIEGKRLTYRRPNHQAAT